VRRAEKIGLVCKDILFCVGYWGSDNPLHADELIAKSHLGGGAVSASALTVAILSKALNQGKACSEPERFGVPLPGEEPEGVSNVGVF
jgi:hypothetical protein